MSQTVFITGTDTGCGKTTVTAALARALVERGNSVACFKPVASGCEDSPAGLRNDDALALMQSASVKLAYEQVNPVALAPPIAPHLAAERAGLVIDPETLARDIRSFDGARLKLVEGAGGWRVPLGEKAMMADLARALGGEVILVVGIRLGCINHALLSASAIQCDDCRLLGWVANIFDPKMDALEGNIDSISARIGPPLARFEPARGWQGADNLWNELSRRGES